MRLFLFALRSYWIDGNEVTKSPAQGLSSTYSAYLTLTLSVNISLRNTGAIWTWDENLLITQHSKTNKPKHHWSVSKALDTNPMASHIWQWTQGNSVQLDPGFITVWWTMKLSWVKDIYKAEKLRKRRTGQKETKCCKINALFPEFLVYYISLSAVIHSYSELSSFPLMVLCSNTGPLSSIHRTFRLLISKGI